MRSRLKLLLVPSVVLLALATTKLAEAHSPPHHHGGVGVSFYIGPSYGAYRASDLRAFHSYPTFQAYYYGYPSYPLYPTYPVGTYPAYPAAYPTYPAYDGYGYPNYDNGYCW